jgi:hypothetical protein
MKSHQRMVKMKKIMTQMKRVKEMMMTMEKRLI